MSPRRKETVEIEGRRIELSNLSKPLYPSGFTKGDLIDYYSRVGPTILPHLRDRPATFKRFPDGTSSQGFLGKNVPRGAPEFLRSVTLPKKAPASQRADGSSGETTTYPLIDDLASLVYFANLAAIELHTPMWRIGPKKAVRNPDMIVFDLDPGAPADITQCCQVALWLRQRAADEKIELYAKTSGSKGLQCYGSVATRRFAAGRTSELARQLAQELEAKEPALVVSQMARALRKDKIFIDWSQNNPAKTTVTVYSLRGLTEPRVSTPVSWDEVEACAKKKAVLSFGPREVLDRLEDLGDLFSPLL